MTSMKLNTINPLNCFCMAASQFGGLFRNKENGHGKDDKVRGGHEKEF